MEIFLKKCPVCGKDHRSFKQVMRCFNPLKHLFEWISEKHPNSLTFNKINTSYQEMKTYMYNRFGCEK